MPLPADRITYTLIEEDGKFKAVHRGEDGRIMDTMHLGQLTGYKLVSPGWWSDIYEWCEVKELEDSR